MTKPKLTFDKHIDKADAISTQTPASCINRSDIIRMAREAGDLNCDCCLPEPEPHEMQEFLERFAALVAAHKRPWVGLTKEEAKEISLANRPYVTDMIAALEARLKEKNA